MYNNYIIKNKLDFGFVIYGKKRKHEVEIKYC